MKIDTMEKRYGVRSLQNMTSLAILFLSFTQLALAQVQSTIGFPYPSSERSPGGIVVPGGGYAIPASNFGHPNSLFGPSSGDWQLVFLGQNGNIAPPSKWYGRPSAEEVSWIELANCYGQSNLVFAGNDGAEMTLALIDLNGDPLWSKRIGTNAHVEAAACVKVDGGGNFVLVGTQFNPITGQQSVVVAKVDCNGNLLWDRIYTVTGWLAEAASVTAFATFPGNCPQTGTNFYYITGKMSRMAGGSDPQVFILAIDATAGALGFLSVYDVNPNAEDSGSCIQAACNAAGQPELWVSGYSYETAAAAQTLLMLKTDVNGLPLWANNYDIANGDEFATHFIIEPNGKLAVTGKAEETVVFQGTKSGDCLLMRINGNGNSIDWARLYHNNGFSSQGNRVEAAPNGAYFITGQALELISPSQSANNILSILTGFDGQANSPCSDDLATTIIPRSPSLNTFSAPQFTISTLDLFAASGLDTLSYNDQQAFCPSFACICDFTFTFSNCFQVNFSVSCPPVPAPAMYSYEWDFDGDGIVDATTASPNISHTYPCGGGIYTVTLNVFLNGMLCGTFSHTVIVSSTCCGPILSTNADCTPNNDIYRFAIEVGNSPGAASCQQPVITANNATIFNLNYTPLPNLWLITGFAQLSASSSTSLNLTVQSLCFCPGTSLPMTCTQTVGIPLPCCKTIEINDLEICHSLDAFDLPALAGAWPPLNGINQVTWYVLPKPPGGCPFNPWGGIPYQDNITGGLEPLHLYPSSLAAGEYCVYVVVHLSDGPCQLLTSNIATLTICTPNSCSLNGYEYFYTGTPIVPGLLTLSINTPANSCQVVNIEWYDPQDNLVQTGGTSYTPTQGLWMQNDQLCYEDIFYTVKITDACGKHTCQARIRLHSCLAPIGTLAITPPEPPFLCATNTDATLTFTPECAGDPPQWEWYQQSCNGGVITHLIDAGTANPTYNTGQLDDSYYFIVEAQNGNCPPKQEQLLVELKSPLAYISFSANSDPCVEQYVDLSLDIAPCTIEGCGTSCNCSYTVDWYKDGSFIGSTANVVPPAQATFSYTSVPLYGSYFAILKADCCPGETLATYPLFFRQSCEPVVMGPCFVCDNQPVQLMAQMILPPDDPCPDICTFSWYAYDPATTPPTTTPLGSGAIWNTTTGGFYILESDCYGCIKRDTFELKECYSNPCRRLVHIEEILSNGKRPLRLFPNPATDYMTLEWLGEAPRNASLFIFDPLGRLMRTISVPDGTSQLRFPVDDLPSGIYFLRVQERGQWYEVAKLVKE